MIKLNLLAYRDSLICSTKDGKATVKCLIRQRDLIVQPEELVRQLLLLYLIEDRQFPKARINVEKGLNVLNQRKRYDILLYDREIKPLAIIEVKAADVPINQSTMEQISAYNLPLRAPCLILTNGLVTYCCLLNQQKSQYDFIDYIPNYEELLSLSNQLQ